MEEEWRPVKGYEGLYEVSNMGRVKSLHYGESRILKQSVSSNGHMKVDLNKDRTSNTKQVHRLVAEAFIPNPMNLSVVNHLDGDKHNNCAFNLEWCTYRQNTLHAIKLGLFNPSLHSTVNRRGPKGKPIVVYTKTGEFVSFFSSATEAAKVLGIPRGSIYEVTNNKYKHIHGYVCKFAK